jgi:phosphonate transport system ATP-binding protein
MLQTQSVLKQFGDVCAVNGVSLTIPPGQMVGIIGRSGAGKSMFLRVLNRLIDLTQGHILFDDMDVGQLTGRTLPPGVLTAP